MSDQRGNYGRNRASGNYTQGGYGRGGYQQQQQQQQSQYQQYQQQQQQHYRRNKYVDDDEPISGGTGAASNGSANYSNYNNAGSGYSGGGYTGGGYGGGNGGNGGCYPPYTVNVPWELYEIKKKNKHGVVCSFFLTLGSIITFARNLVFNIIFVLLMIFMFGGYMAVQSFKEAGMSFSTISPEDLDKTALQAEVLYFDLNGAISEIPFASSQFDNLQRQLELSLYGRQSHEIVAIENALNLVANDSAIKKVIIDVDGMGPLTLSMAERIGKAMDVAKGTDENNPREVVVIGTNMSQSAYAMASHASKIVLDPLGEIDFKGISMSTLYLKDLLDRFDITPYIFRAGHFKSAVEPFMFNSMSPDVRREYQAIAFKSWDIYQQHIREQRTIKSNTVLPDAAAYIQWLKQFKGDRAQMQLAQGIVDSVMPTEQYLMNLTDEVNADADFPYRPAIITYQDYLLRHHIQSTGSNRVGALSQIEVRPQQSAQAGLAASAAPATAAVAAAATAATAATADSAVSSAVAAIAENAAAVAQSVAADSSASNGSAAAPRDLKNAPRKSTGLLKVAGTDVAVIYGIGEITDTTKNPTDFTYDNLGPLLEDAQNDESVGAVVLYLNSPGGSVIASEKIRRAVELFQSSGKPLIVSMNGTAASGAYWIASQADTIFATESTITGSIGVFGLTFGVHRLLNRYGTYQDGVVTNELAAMPIADEMPATQQQLISMSVEKTYRTFIELVARNRGLKVNEYEIFAEGQVFLADDARSIGLVDELGDLSDAIAFAAKEAQIKDADLHVRHIAPGASTQLGGFESIIFGLSTAYLPDELTYSLVELKKKSELISTPNNKAILAISPLSEPKL